MESSKKSKIYFPSLNGIRAIAALFVLWHHIEQVKDHYNIANIENYFFQKKLGSTGVTLFFVLSGFLITYLLFVEDNIAKTINIKQFYIRRILRIWPVYFLIIFLSLFYDIYQNDWQYVHGFFTIKLFLFVGFLPNVCNIIYSASGFPSQLWSVGSEEQFYLVWPHLIKRNIINSLKTLFIFIVIISSFRLIFFFLDKKYSFSLVGIDVFNLMWRFLYFFRVDCMAIGAITAFLFYNKNKYTKLLKLLYSFKVQIITFGIIILLLVLPSFLGLLQDTFFAFCFAIVILNVATNRKSILNLEFPVFNFLGKISYGLYVYHPLIIIILIKPFVKNSLFSNTLYHIIFYVLVILFTTAIAYFSFNYFEKLFLKFKIRYSIVESGNSVKN